MSCRFYARLVKFAPSFRMEQSGTPESIVAF
jgi:hypothetical protein